MTKKLFIGPNGGIGQKYLLKRIGELEIDADCLDLWALGNEPDGVFRQAFHALRDRERSFELLRNGAYDSVYISTPPRYSGQYLMDLLGCDVKLIVVEKPYCKSHKAALGMSAVVEASNVAARCIDHYGFKPVSRWLAGQAPPLDFLIGGRPQRITAWLFEPEAATTPAQLVGSMADQLIHLLEFNGIPVPGCPLNLERAYGGRYWGAPGREYAETFCWVWGTAGSTEVNLSAAKRFSATGKDISGRFPATPKGAVIEGPDATLEIDFTHNSATLVTGDVRQVVYEPDEQAEDEYTHILRRFADGDVTLGMTFDRALSLLKVVAEARRTFQWPLPRYLDVPPAWSELKRKAA